MNWLIDLNTENDYVVSTLNSWIHDLVLDYGIDGIRIDTVKHIRKDFWPGFNTAAGVYSVGEVANGDAGYTCPYQDYLDGVLNYPFYYSLTKTFGTRDAGSMKDLSNQIEYIKSLCKDTTLLPPFLENHDQPRVRCSILLVAVLFIRSSLRLSLRI